MTVLVGSKECPSWRLTPELNLLTHKLRKLRSSVNACIKHVKRDLLMVLISDFVLNADVMEYGSVLGRGPFESAGLATVVYRCHQGTVPLATTCETFDDASAGQDETLSSE